MISLATIKAANELLLSMFPNLNMDALSVEELVKLAEVCDPSRTTPKVETVPPVPPVKKDKYIKFGRDGSSFITFYESDLQGNADAIFLAKCMKLLMVEYRKTSVDAATILLGRVSNNYAVYVSWCGGWGKFFVRMAERLNVKAGVSYAGFSDSRLENFIASETARNAHNLINLKEILSSMSL